jgi:hypothetical protein
MIVTIGSNDEDGWGMMIVEGQLAMVDNGGSWMVIGVMTCITTIWLGAWQNMLGRMICACVDTIFFRPNDLVVDKQWGWWSKGGHMGWYCFLFFFKLLNQ